MQHRPLGATGLSIPILAYGASGLGGVFGDIDEATGIRAVHTAIDLGMDFIDVSPFYGLTKAETVLGKALATVPRDRYLLATKVGRYGAEIDDFDFSAKRVAASVDESLRRLGVEYLDLIQCHDIEFGDLAQIVDETLPALRSLRDQGKVRFVGITGLPLSCFRQVCARTTVDTILSYCHYTLNDDSLVSLLPEMQAKGIGVINASPFAMGLLVGKLPPWHPAPDALRAVCARAAAHCRSKGTDIAKLAVQFSCAHPGIAATCVGSADSTQIAECAAWSAEPMDHVLLAEVQEILAPIRNQTWMSGRPENNGDASR